MSKQSFTVEYRGFLQGVSRTFSTYERAAQWARQVGKEKSATINGEVIK